VTKRIVWGALAVLALPILSIPTRAQTETDCIMAAATDEQARKDAQVAADRASRQATALQAERQALTASLGPSTGIPGTLAVICSHLGGLGWGWLGLFGGTSVPSAVQPQVEGLRRTLLNSDDDSAGMSVTDRLNSAMSRSLTSGSPCRTRAPPTTCSSPSTR
jgi:hypothetical protein